MEDTIIQYIQQVLQREPAPDEVEGWVALMNEGMTIEEVRDIIIQSGDAQVDVYPVILTYQAIYGRVPDAEGLAYWVGRYRDVQELDNPETTTINEGLVELLKPFVNPAQTPEFVARFGANPTGAQFVAAAYTNVLNRPADAEGLAYWTQAYARVQAEVAASNPGASAAEIAITTRAIMLEQFVSSDEYRVATQDEVKNFLTLAAEANPDAYSGSLWSFQDISGEVTLTEGVDIRSGNVFNAPRGWTPGGTDQVNTLNDDDVLTGTGTNPTLNFTFVQDSDIGSNIITPTLNGIETVNVQFATQQGAAFLDAQDATGIRNVNLSRISMQTAEAGVLNLGAEANNLSVNSTSAPATDIYFTYLNQALTGADDEVTLTLNKVTTDHIHVETTVPQQGVGVETLNLVSTGAPNHVNHLYVEDLETLVISGDQALTLGAEGVATRAGGQVEATRYEEGLRNVAGSLDTIDASALDAGLTITLGGEVVANQDGTSGKAVDFSFTGTGHDDTVRLLAGLNKGDTFDLGEGNDTVVLYQTATAGALNGVEIVELRSGHDADNKADPAIEFDASIAPDLEAIIIRNEGQWLKNGEWVTTAEDAVFELTKLTPEVADNITVLHGTTGNNGWGDTVVSVSLAEDTASDTVGVTLADGVNIDPRFNFQLIVNKVENVTIRDEDTESNSLLIWNDKGTPNIAKNHNSLMETISGTITIEGANQAGNFLNLDWAGANLLRLDITGGTNDLDGIFDAKNNVATRFVGEKIDASAYTGDLIVRVAENIAVPTGAQTILGGSGNDHIVFDALNSSTAGLSISDTVDGGDGHDVLYLDGHGKIVNISASEWTNVSNIEEVHLVGNGQADNTGTPGQNDAYGQNAYNLTLTNDFIAANGAAVDGGRRIIITNDNGENGAANDGVTIDARALNAQSSFQYNGRSSKNAGDLTADRFILSDANINGLALIDGGAELDSHKGNQDILEIRNAAVVTIGDLAGISNVSNIELTNDQAAAQTFVLQLDNETIDRLVNSSLAADAANPETLNIGVYNNPLIIAAVSTLNLDLTQVTEDYLGVSIQGGDGSQVITVTGSHGVTINGGAGDDTITGGAGNDTIFGGPGNDTLNGGDGDDSIFGNAGTDTINGGAGNDTIDGGGGVDILNGDDGDDIIFGAGGGDTINGGAGNDIIIGGAGADTLTGGTGNDLFVYTDASESTNAVRDVITDFGVGNDTIDLSQVLGNGGVNPAAITNAGAALSGAANEFAGNAIARFYDGANTLVYVDVDGSNDFNAGDMVIQLTGNIALTGADFLI